MLVRAVPPLGSVDLQSVDSSASVAEPVGPLIGRLMFNRKGERQTRSLLLQSENKGLAHYNS